MLEHGRPGSAGTERGERPVLGDVALPASDGRQSATGVVGRQARLFTGSELRSPHQVFLLRLELGLQSRAAAAAAA